MNWFLEQLPESVEVGGREYPIRPDFRAFMLIDMIVRDPLLDDEERIRCALEAFYREIPEDTAAAVEKMLWFQRGGVSDTKDRTSQAAKRRTRAKKERALDYGQDSGYIWAAFLQAYRLDLSDSALRLHWWMFLKLLEALPEDCRLCRIMYYRTADVSGMGSTQKKSILKLRELYRLKDEADTGERMKLADRNRNMIEYVRRRYRETGGEGNGGPV